jgi:hypothetical protein
MRRTIKAIIALASLTLATSAMAVPPDSPDYKWLEQKWRETVATRPSDPVRPMPSTTTVLRTGEDRYSTITTYADGHKTFSDIFPMSGGQAGIISR